MPHFKTWLMHLWAVISMQFWWDAALSELPHSWMNHRIKYPVTLSHSHLNILQFFSNIDKECSLRLGLNFILAIIILSAACKLSMAFLNVATVAGTLAEISFEIFEISWAYYLQYSWGRKGGVGGMGSALGITESCCRLQRVKTLSMLPRDGSSYAYTKDILSLVQFQTHRRRDKLWIIMQNDWHER